MKNTFKIIILLFVVSWADQLLACCTEFDSMCVGSTGGRPVPASWKGRNMHSKDKEDLGERRALADFALAGLRFLGTSKVEGNQGVDLIFWDKATKTLVFHESKFDWGGSFRPRKNKVECPQGTVEWVEGNIKRMKESKDPATKETARALSRVARWVEKAFRTANVVKASGRNDYHAISNKGDAGVMGILSEYLHGLIEKTPDHSFPTTTKIKPHKVDKGKKVCGVRKRPTMTGIIRGMASLRVAGESYKMDVLPPDMIRSEFHLYCVFCSM